MVLGDGSTWIWNTATELFPKAIQILDRFHAKDALHRSSAILGAASAEATMGYGGVPNWMRASCNPSSKRSGPISAPSNEAAKCAIYIIRNRRRMRYPKFHHTGFMHLHWRPGGRMQSSDRHPAQAGWHALDRLRRNAIIALRCSKLSGRFEDFWERRSTSLKAAA